MHHASLLCILLLDFESRVHLFVQVGAASRHRLRKVTCLEFVRGVYRKSAICVLQSWSDSIFGTVVLYDFLSSTLILFSLYFFLPSSSLLVLQHGKLKLYCQIALVARSTAN